ncbi:DUF2948 family protein [Paracoccus sp. 1_MG-2023]|uniref:DUF2948 family protein n=1 Tax=unclassified Paracoccus (in: a-proteobacteria) TaxID=2688777 RepID=UPI001C0A2C45|nr:MULTISPECIES: DUF2948 family protein [unclassified Paracoccus (in: a-proteobacteria)]MBU2958497.1 DUF2948 family protein [Paracoccus sp. C2R09]MDO6668518.1 DUF2948 family protein [Paracoccus sp. 1_MG-2023]
MAEDARFADADPRPLAIRAEDETDLGIMSSFVQDAVLIGTDISHDTRARRLALLVNRFRWEDVDAARSEGRDFERVRSVLVINDVLRVLSDGVARDEGSVLELLAIRWQPGEDGTGKLTLDFAGDGTIMAEVECINLDLRDVTRPHKAVSGKVPHHPE